MPGWKKCFLLFRKYEPKKVGFKTADMAYLYLWQKKKLKLFELSFEKDWVKNEISEMVCISH
jgi:hypothetical protein